MISIQNLFKSFDDESVLRDISLECSLGELNVLIGASGSGKSTLIRCLNGLEVMDHGKIRIADSLLEKKPDSPLSDKEFRKQAHQLRANVGMVFQSFNLFPHLTVLENITIAPIVVQNKPKEDAIKKAKELLEKVGLSSRASYYPSQISGGQQQRAAIARALAMIPKVLLYDEPTSALDPGLVDEVLSVMKKLKNEGMTQLVVTHEMHFAKEAADHVIYIEEGEIVEKGTPAQMFSSPQNEKTKRYLKRYLPNGETQVWN